MKPQAKQDKEAPFTQDCSTQFTEVDKPSDLLTLSQHCAKEDLGLSICLEMLKIPSLHYPFCFCAYFHM